jgi:hypothetical protein
VHNYSARDSMVRIVYFAVMLAAVLPNVVGKHKGPGEAGSSDVAAVVQALERTGATVETLDLHLNQVPVAREDQYSCHQYVAPGAAFAFAFEALQEAFGGHVHHMLVYGCDGPKVHDRDFACGMGEGGGPCIEGSSHPTHLFGWARDARGFALPKHTGIPLGSSTHIKTVVIQVHYAVPPLDDRPDSSGVRMYFTRTPRLAAITQSAGVVSSAATKNLVIPPRAAHTTIATLCTWVGHEPLDVFAFRVHAHSLAYGLPITWEVRHRGEAVWRLASRRDPALAQVFTPLEAPVRIGSGDSWRLNCSYNSLERAATVRVGQSRDAEMCNLYLMANSTQSMLRFARIHTQCVDAALRPLRGGSVGNMNSISSHFTQFPMSASGRGSTDRWAATRAAIAKLGNSS